MPSDKSPHSTPEPAAPATAQQPAPAPWLTAYGKGLVKGLVDFTHAQPAIDLTQRFAALQKTIQEKSAATGRPYLAGEMMLALASQYPKNEFSAMAGRLQTGVGHFRRLPEEVQARLQQGFPLQGMESLLASNPEALRAGFMADPELRDIYRQCECILDETLQLGKDRLTAYQAGWKKSVGAGANGVGTALGLYGLYQKFDSGSLAHDWQAGGAQAALGAIATPAADVANSVHGVGSIALTLAERQSPATLNTVAAMAAARPLLASAIRHAAIPLAVAAGTFDAGAGIAAGDSARVNGAMGRTAGGIGGGLLAGAASGAYYGALTGTAGGPGFIVTTAISALIGGYYGARYGEMAGQAIDLNRRVELTPQQVLFYDFMDRIPPLATEGMSAPLKELVQAKAALLAKGKALEDATRAFPPPDPGLKRRDLEKAEQAFTRLYEKFADTGAIARVMEEIAGPDAKENTCLAITPLPTMPASLHTTPPGR